MAVEGSPGSTKKVVNLEGSPASARKSSVRSITSLHSDSTLHSSADGTTVIVPESPLMQRKHNYKVPPEMSPMTRRKTSANSLNSESSFPSPIIRRRNPECGGLQNFQSSTLRRKELFRPSTAAKVESFRNQREVAEPVLPKSPETTPSTARKLSLSEDKLWRLPDSGRRPTEAVSPDIKRLQAPVIASPTLRSSNQHSKYLVRRCSERLPSETVADPSLSATPLRSEVKQKIEIIENKRICDSYSKNEPCYGSGSVQNDKMSRRHVEESTVGIQKDSIVAHKVYSLPVENSELFVANTVGASAERSVNKSVLKNESAETNKASNAALRERENTNVSRRVRKKNRSILMEPLEVNWSVDELRSIFQNESEPPPRLDTAYSTCALK